MLTRLIRYISEFRRCAQYNEDAQRGSSNRFPWSGCSWYRAFQVRWSSYHVCWPPSRFVACAQKCLSPVLAVYNFLGLLVINDKTSHPPPYSLGGTNVVFSVCINIPSFVLSKISNNYAVCLAVPPPLDVQLTQFQIRNHMHSFPSSWTFNPRYHHLYDMYLYF